MVEHTAFFWHRLLMNDRMDTRVKMFSKIEVDNNSQSTQRKGSYPEDSQMSNLDVYVYMFANVCMHR